MSQASSRAVVVGGGSGIGWAGFVHTPLTDLVTMAPGVIEDYVENTPLGWVGVPEDVAEALKRYPDVLAHVDRMASA